MSIGFGAWDKAKERQMAAVDATVKELVRSNEEILDFMKAEKKKQNEIEAKLQEECSSKKVSLRATGGYLDQFPKWST